jgi:hypothetical protein
MRSVPRIPRHLIYATTLRIGVISLTLLTGVAVGIAPARSDTSLRDQKVRKSNDDT